MSEPKISIIIPVYNVEKYLRECLDSCISQTLKDIEIICVDDASPDNSIKILEEYQAKDSRIKIFRHKENKNLGAARNTGLQNATGEYVWFVDSDDFIDTKACQILYNAIKEFDVDMLCFSALRFSETEGIRHFFYDKYYHQGVQINKIYHPKTNWKEIIFKHLNVTAWAYITQTSVIQKFRFREGVWHEDVDFTPILLSSVNSFCYIPYTAYLQRTNCKSITQTIMSQKRLEDLIQALESLNDFVVNNKIKKDHFLYRYAASMAQNILKISKNTTINPSNFDTFLKLKKKYRLQKYSLRRFIGKVLKRMFK